MKVRLPLALLIALASPAAAQTLMTAEEFDAWSTGHTLDYWIEGQYWGSERHLSGRQTIDRVDDYCHAGLWFPQDGAICFQYEDSDATTCWFFWRDGDTVTAKTVDAGPEVPPYVVTTSDDDLNCPGPDVGV